MASVVDRGESDYLESLEAKHPRPGNPANHARLGNPANHARLGVSTPIMLLVAVLTVSLATSAALNAYQIHHHASTASSVSPPPPTFALEIPINIQQTPYTCGPTSLASVLQAYGFNVTEQSLAVEMRSNDEDGTLWVNMVNASVVRLLRVTSSNNLTLPQIQDFLVATRGVVIVAYQAYRVDNDTTPWPLDWIDGHYSVIIGWNSTGVLLMDPSQDEGCYGFIPTSEFVERWHDVDGCCTPVVQFGMMIWSETVKLPLAPDGWPSAVHYTW